MFRMKNYRELVNNFLRGGGGSRCPVSCNEPPPLGLSSKLWQKVDHSLFLSPGQRGIRVLFTQDELLRSCLALSHSFSVAITTGFPTHYMHRYLHVQ